MVYCVYSLESPHQGNSYAYENTTYLHVKEYRKDIPVVPSDLAI